MAAEFFSREQNGTHRTRFARDHILMMTASFAGLHRSKQLSHCTMIGYDFLTSSKYSFNDLTL